MGWLFKSKEERQREKEEIKARVESSECMLVVKKTVSELFDRENGEYLEWLLVNSKERSIQLDVYNDGILFTLFEFNRERYKKEETYEVDKRAYLFGTAGYENLPNSKYVSVFREYLYDFIKTNCTSVAFYDYNKIRLADGVKKGW